MSAAYEESVRSRGTSGVALGAFRAVSAPLYLMYPQISGPSRVEKGIARVRSIRVAFALLAMMLVSTACGARLSSKDLAAARRSATGIGVTAGEASGGQSTDTGGTAGSAGGTGAASGATVGGAASAGGGAKAAAGAAAASSTGGATCKSGTPSSDPGVSATEIHFGNVSTTGGPVPGIFAGARDGVNAFFAYQNSQGGLCGRQLKLDFQDDNLDASRNQQAYQQLSAKDLGIVGSFSVVDEGGSQVIGSHPDMPDASYALSKARYSLANNFSPQPLRVPGWPLGTLQYFKTTFGPSVITKMAYFTEDVQSAKDAASGQKAAASSLGYQFVYERVTEPTDTDFTADVSNMKGKGVRGVMMAGDAGQMARIAAAMKAQGFTVPLATWGANAYDKQFVDNSQGGSEGALISPVATAIGSRPAYAFTSRTTGSIGSTSSTNATYSESLRSAVSCTGMS